MAMETCNFTHWASVRVHELSFLTSENNNAKKKNKQTNNNQMKYL